MSVPLKVLILGQMRYSAALNVQMSLHNRILSGDSTDNTLIIVEHNPVYTAGLRRSPYEHLDADEFRKIGADFHLTNRGGLITFHGPGQLVAYPILNLRHWKAGARWHICNLQETAQRLCDSFDVRTSLSADTGVWVGNNKIAAIGVHINRMVTMHGMAVNCNTDIHRWFDRIVACGLDGKGVTSISRELGRNVGITDCLATFLKLFCDQYDCTVIDRETVGDFQSLPF